MLKDFYIGDSVEYISVEYAKSGRSACKTCKQKIGMNQLRVGILVDDDHFSTGQGTQWFHKACFNFKPRHKALELDTLNKKIHNIEALEKKDQKQILTYLKAQLKTVKQGKLKTKAGKNPRNVSNQKTEKSSKSQSKPKSNKPQTKEEKSNKTKEKVGNRSKSHADEKREKSKEEVKPKSRGKKVQEKKEVPKRQPSTRTGLRSRSVATVNLANEAEVQPKKMLKKVDKPKKVAPKKFLSQAQNKQFKEYQQDFDKLTLPELKEILAKNNQAKTGTKPELVAKCADGKLLGRIPTCHKCGGGKLRFDRLTGKYECPGYMEDTDFITCKAKFDFDEVKRLEWNN